MLNSLVPSPHHACEESYGLGTYWCQFLVLQSQLSCDYLHRLILGSHDCLHRLILDHVMVHKTKKTLPVSLDPFPSGVWGLGTRLHA